MNQKRSRLSSDVFEQIQKDKQKRKKSSLRNTSDYKIGDQSKLSKMERSFSGDASEFDDISFIDEYGGIASVNKGVTGASKSMFQNADYMPGQSQSVSEFDQAYQGMPSKFDDIPLEGEYPGQEESAKDLNQCSHTLSNDEYNQDMEEFIYAWETDKKTPSEPENKPPIFVPNGMVQAVEKGDEEENGKIDRALAIAEDFARKQNLIRVGGAIYIYNGKFFSLFSDDAIQKLIFQNYRKEISCASPVSTLRNAATLLRYSVQKELEEFPVNPNLVVFQNGTLEISTGHFRQNSPKDLASSALGINYDGSRREMPNTSRFLKMIADGDSDLYELMLQVIGYILSNDIKAKSFFYVEGVGDAGKSRFCDLIASFFPISGSNKVARIALQDLGGKYALGNLVNARLNISEDLPDNPLSPTTVSRIKMISDSNRLEAEAKYVQPFSFKPLCKLLFASNHPLRIKEYDKAFVNRVVYIPFFHSVPKHRQDINILQKMQEELPALFNHALAAYRRLVQSGYIWSGNEKFKPEIHVVGSSIANDKERALRDFVDSCCVFDKTAVVSVQELQSVYYAFCIEKKYTPIVGDRFSRELFNVLPDSVSRIKIGNKKRGFKGLRLLQLSAEASNSV